MQNLQIMNIRKTEQAAQKAFVFGCRMLKMANRKRCNASKSKAMVMINRARKVLKCVSVRIKASFACNLLKLIKTGKCINYIETLRTFVKANKALHGQGLSVCWDAELRCVKVMCLKSNQVY